MAVGGVVSDHVWHRGRLCEGGACVEIASGHEGVMLRSTLNPDAPLAMSHDEWQAFLADAKAGLFDEV